MKTRTHNQWAMGDPWAWMPRRTCFHFFGAEAFNFFKHDHLFFYLWIYATNYTYITNINCIKNWRCQPKTRTTTTKLKASVVYDIVLSHCFLIDVPGKTSMNLHALEQSSMFPRFSMNQAVTYDIHACLYVCLWFAWHRRTLQHSFMQHEKLSWTFSENNNYWLSFGKNIVLDNFSKNVQ